MERPTAYHNGKMGFDCANCDFFEQRVAARQAGMWQPNLSFDPLFHRAKTGIAVARLLLLKTLNTFVSMRLRGDEDLNNNRVPSGCKSPRNQYDLHSRFRF